MAPHGHSCSRSPRRDAEAADTPAVTAVAEKSPFCMTDLRDLEGAQRDDFLKQVYDELLMPHFPVEGELDDLDDMSAGLDKADGRDPEYHIVVARDRDTDELAGCACYEYYPIADCCLMSYICVAAAHRRKGVSQQLIRKMELQLLARTNGRPVAAIFAETHESTVQDGIMDPLQRQEVLASLGFRCLDFAYTQPPLNEREKPCGGLRLLVKDKELVPSDAVIAYLDGFAGSVTGWDDSWKGEPYYQAQVRDLSARPNVQATAKRPW
uniref:N-acetyltransferase domain-containing protein n=1 Tax=Spumella elongata TaxID=89044 RepID=A0A7S3HR84_9STRA|mmetsp:Transcript_160423/g.514894  ORF Transcript_160423/g.514894 Transcript_160423/m.514894 type:complete len:267 (-) Transcript_160423:39-839(-)